MVKSKQELIAMPSAQMVTPSAQMVMASGVDELLEEIRPEWKAKSLIQRVKAILPVDPSSACQRLLNAAIHDLREKIIIAGLDVAKEAATLHKLPSVAKPEDVYGYSTTNTLDLTYRMGLINRPNWRRLKRAYDIRKDLEHEDDQYEAGVEDCVYVFRTCIEIVLSKDPIAPVRVVDIKDIVESPENVLLSAEVVDDYDKAPDVRQVDITKFLISISGDSDKPDIIRQNAIEALWTLQSVTRKAAQAEVGQFMQRQLRQKPIELVDMKIAAAAGIVPYLKQKKMAIFFEDFWKRMKDTGYQWTKHNQHGKLLDDFDDIGGLDVCPEDIREKIVLWTVRCYLGEPGGYGMGINRNVFYSNVAAPWIENLFKQFGALIEGDLEAAATDKLVKAAVSDKQIARRLEKLRDLVSSKAP